MKCANCSGGTLNGKLQCASCGSAVSLLAPGKMVPRLQQARAIELVSSSPNELLWLAEKGSGHQKILIAEYEPRGGGSAFLRDFRSWYHRLKALPTDLLPALLTRFSCRERLFLVLDGPAGQSVKNVIESGRTPIPAHEFLHHLLNLTRRFSELLPGSSHGYICAESVTILSDGKLLLGPPAFNPGEATDPHSDLRECALLAAQCAGIQLRYLHKEAQQRDQLQLAQDWVLAAAIEWILFYEERSPQSTGHISEFLSEAISARRVFEFLSGAVSTSKEDSEESLSKAFDTLKRLYRRSGSTIIRREMERVSIWRSSLRKAGASQ